MKKYDLIVIGMGPAGMAVSAMGSSMGLKVLAIEKNKVGGECLNCGCIPSKALLKVGNSIFSAKNLNKYSLNAKVDITLNDPLGWIRSNLDDINNNKVMKVFEKVDLVIGKGNAVFKNKKIVVVNNQEYTARYIFIATGTAPFMPPIPGLNNVSKLTNINLFDQKDIPKSLMIIGGGAIGTEMGQAFSRLGTKVTIVHADKHLIPNGDEEAGRYLESFLKKEGIEVYNNSKVESVIEEDGEIISSFAGKVFKTQKILVAAGRIPVLESLNLEKASINYDVKKGIIVDKYLRTNQKNIYAIGDCNGNFLLSHAAMHQGMLALIHATSPLSLSMFKFKKYPVPWSVFTTPEVAQVGLTEKEASQRGLKFIVMRKTYDSYGRTVVDGNPQGFIKVITNKFGKIYGATIVGESAGELIQTWTLAIQFNIKMHQIMLMQHSFPTISMLNKMISEDWMMHNMKSSLLKKMVGIFYNFN